MQPKKMLLAVMSVFFLLLLPPAEAKADPLTITLANPNQTTFFDSAFFYATLVNNTSGSIGSINYSLSAPGTQALLLSQFAPSSLGPGETWGLAFGPQHLFTVLTPFFGPVGVTYSGVLTVNYRELATGQLWSVNLPFQVTTVQAPDPEPVPEPATVLLLATGLAATGARAASRCRRRRGRGGGLT